MNCKILVYFIIINYFSEALPSDAGYTDYTLSSLKDEYQRKLSKKGEKQKIKTSTEPISSYEVTEIVIDIPDDRTIGPIQTNYTIPTPLNISSTTKIPANKNDQVIDEKEEKKNCKHKLSKEGEKQKIETTTKPISSYEVTEIVSDIPNDENC